MHIQDIFKLRKTSISFEFFPPKTRESADVLFEHIRKLEAKRPAFVSMTYGAGGSTRGLTQELVVRIKKETALDVVPHLTCVYHTEAEIYDILELYAGAGVSNILCLGGDPPNDKPDYDRSRDAFRYGAELVRFTRAFKQTQGGQAISEPRGFGIGVAGFPEGHPGTPNRLQEMDYFKAKVDAGADFIITQLFFENRDFYDFRDRCRLAGIKVPIIAGVMPVTSATGLVRMAELAAGARFPASLLKSIERTGGKAEGVRRVGVHWATEQCRDLLDHDVDGVHLYTLNRSTATLDIYANLGVEDSMSLA
jgi:methylenetetrahydrofolate reductase (NADPH)